MAACRGANAERPHTDRHTQRETERKREGESEKETHRDTHHMAHKAPCAQGHHTDIPLKKQVDKDSENRGDAHRCRERDRKRQEGQTEREKRG